MSVETKRAIRTVLQTAVALCVLLPEVIAAAGIPESLPWVAGALAVAGAVARVMALPSVQRFLDRFGLGTLEEPPSGGPNLKLCK